MVPEAVIAMLACARIGAIHSVVFGGFASRELAARIDPLESTSIHLIQTGILKLLALLPDKSFSEVEIEEYDRAMNRQFDYIRDFIILHYHATERSDSEFWNYCRTMDIPGSLKRRIELFRSSGRIFRYEDELFDVSNWVAVFLGQAVTPLRYDPRADTMSVADLQAMLGGLRAAIGRAAQAMPAHLDHIKAIGGGAELGPKPAT